MRQKNFENLFCFMPILSDNARIATSCGSEQLVVLSQLTYEPYFEKLLENKLSLFLRNVVFVNTSFSPPFFRVVFSAT